MRSPRTTARRPARRAVADRPAPRLGRFLPAMLAGALLAPAYLPVGADRAAAAESGSGMAVSVVRAKRACFSDAVRTTGTVVPKEESQVRPDVEAGRVTQILVEPGDSVTVGQPLAKLARMEGGNVPAQALTVTAPAAGTVGRIMTAPGAMAAMGGPPMFLIVVGGEFELSAEIPSTRIGKIAVDQPARVDVAGVGELTGRVRLVSPEINVANQTGQARISFAADPRTKTLKMGTFGRATIEVGTSCGVSVPLSAILYGPVGPVVQVVRDNRVETRKVAVGLLSGGNVELRQGLNEGDLVVKRAGTFLRDDDRVRPIVEGDARAAR